MRKLTLGLAAAASLSMASTANAAITLGPGAGTNSGNLAVAVTDNINIPNKLVFDTTNASGTVTSYFDFSESYLSYAVFTLGAATNPFSTVSLVEVLTGNPLSVIQTAGPNLNSVTFITATLAANTVYRLRYTVNLGSPGTVSGNGTFYQGAVPEPATWGMMLLGFAGIGFAMRRRRQPALAQLA